MEHGAATLFARFLTGNWQLPETAIAAGGADKQEPDALLHVGIEVTSVYYGDDDARDVRELFDDLDKGIRRRTQIRGVPTANQTFVERAQILLERKATRPYGVPTYLVLDARLASVHSADDGPSLVAQLRVPATAKFEGVFLLLSRNAFNGPGGVDFFEVTNRAAT